VKPFEPVFPIATAVPTWNIGLIEDLPFYEIPTPIPEWEIGVLEDLPFYEIPTLPLGGGCCSGVYHSDITERKLFQFSRRDQLCVGI